MVKLPYTYVVSPRGQARKCSSPLPPYVGNGGLYLPHQLKQKSATSMRKKTSIDTDDTTHQYNHKYNKPTHQDASNKGIHTNPPWPKRRRATKTTPTNRGQVRPLKPTAPTKMTAPPNPLPTKNGSNSN